MKIGYARVSTGDQKMYAQRDALKAEGCEKIFEDVGCGAKQHREGLDQALGFIRNNDVLVVTKLDRLGRSTQHLIETVKSFDERNILFKSLKENIDTSTSTGKLIFHIFSALAEFERDIIRERTNAGLVAARARGRFGGRPLTLEPKEIARMIEIYDSKKTTIREICAIYNITPGSLYNYLKRQNKINLEAEAKVKAKAN